MHVNSRSAFQLRNTRRLLAATALMSVTMLGLAPVAMAQESGANPVVDQDAASEGGLDVIIVTAERRAQSVQKTPISVSAFGADQIAKSNIVGVEDIVTRTPNFAYQPFALTDPQLSIRGIGSSEDGAGGDPSVAVFQDDIVFGRSTGQATQLYDVERVEVLRGPQGTLYGKNVAGGALRILTMKPQFENSGSIEITPIGDHGRIGGTLVGNVKLSDQLALRVAGMSTQHDGYNFNIVTGNKVDDLSSQNARVRLRYQPSSDFDAILSVNINRDRIDGDTRKPLPAGTFAASTPGIVVDPDPRIRQPSHDGFLNRDIWSAALNMDWGVGVGEISSITGYREVSFNWYQALGGLPDNFLLVTDNLAKENADQFTQEFRFTGATTDESLQWTTGIFYSNDNVDRDETFIRSFAGRPSNPSFIQNVDAKSFAIYGEAKYNFDDTLSLTVGARQTWDKKSGTFSVIDNIAATSGGYVAPATTPYSNVNVSDKWSAFTPKVTLGAEVNPDLFFYGTISKGYKAGGFQSAPPSAAAVTVSFSPEQVWNYEIGMRSEWFDRRLRFNATGFYMDYTDLQVQQLVFIIPGDLSSSVLVTDNAGAVTIKGVELETLANLAHGLNLGVNYSYIDAKFDEFVTSTGADLAGNRLRRTPKSSLSVFGDYEIEVSPNGGSLAFRAEYGRKGSFYFENENTPTQLQESYGLFDASLRYLSPDEDWEVSLWGKNLSDKVYRTAAISVRDTGFSKIGAPTTWGMTFKYRFGH